MKWNLQLFIIFRNHKEVNLIKKNAVEFVENLLFMEISYSFINYKSTTFI